MIGASAAVMSIDGTSILVTWESCDLRLNKPLTSVTAIMDTDGDHDRFTHGSSFISGEATFEKMKQISSQLSHLLGAVTTPLEVACAITEASTGKALTFQGKVQDYEWRMGLDKQLERLTVKVQGAVTGL